MAGPDVFDEDESDVDETKIGALDSAKVALLVEAANIVAKDYSFRELIQLLELYARSDSRVKCKTGAVADIRAGANSKRSYEDKTFPIISDEEKSKLATLLAGLPTHEEFIERVVADLDRRLKEGRMVRESLLAARGKEILTKLISGGWRTGGNNEAPASVDTGVTKMGGLGVSPRSASAAAAASSTATQRSRISYKDMNPGGLSFSEEDWEFAAEVAAEIMDLPESTKSISGKSPSHKKGRMHSPKATEFMMQQGGEGGTGGGKGDKTFTF